MSLSQNLINQFVKVVNYKEKEKKENTVNGTFKTIDGIKYVQIDGSDIWTPVDAMVEAEDGDRVKVSIKNHNATITGNITNPSASSTSVQDMKDTVDEHGNTIQQLNNSIQQQENSIIQIDNSIKQVENTILQYDNTINQQNNKIQQFENTINQQGDTITSMNNTITQQGNDIESINNTVIAQGNTITQHDNVIEQQGNIIKGKVVDMKGEPVIGATVKEIGTNNGAITDINGNFLITVQPNASLEVSFIGYKTEIQKAITGKTLAITLKENNEILDEVVIVGYGVQKKANLTGSVDNIDGQIFKNRPASNITTLMQGAVPNLNINFTSGRPNSSPAWNVRGLTSMVPEEKHSF